MEIDPLGELEEALMDRTTASKNRKQRIFIEAQNRPKPASSCNRIIKLEFNHRTALKKKKKSIIMLIMIAMNNMIFRYKKILRALHPIPIKIILRKEL